MNSLKGKSIIVTGGGSGIGGAAVQLLAEAGALVTIADLSESHGNEMVKSITSNGGKAQFVKTNVSDEQSVKHMVDFAVAAYGRLDGACNAAGVPQRGKPLADVTIEEWDNCHSVNLRGLFLCNKYQILAMLKNGGGSIVNIASTAAVVGFPNGAEYCASKAGVLGLVRGAAIDYATQGIRINAIMPGATLTPMLKAAMDQDPNLEPALASVHPMNRFAQPREIAAGALWLLSDEASFATGAAYPVDGGHSAI
ncbi:MAG: SDR family NAD(P)-dependent oxidoreductase [Porticoccaceae bacterium]